MRAAAALRTRRFDVLYARDERLDILFGSRRARGGDDGANIFELRKRADPASTRSDLARAAGLGAQDRLVFQIRAIGHVLVYRSAL